MKFLMSHAILTSLFVYLECMNLPYFSSNIKQADGTKPSMKIQTTKCDEKVCYCLFTSGDKIKGTESFPGSTMYCDEITACMLERHTALHYIQDFKMISSYVPKCSEKGAYAKKQCGGDKRMGCWCSDEQGNPLKTITAEEQC